VCYQHAAHKRARARDAEASRAPTVHGTGAARHYDAGAETGAAATPQAAAA